MRIPGPAWVWGLVAAGVALRVTGLGDAVWWHDEVFTRVFATGHAPRQWFSEVYGRGPVTAADLLRFQQLDPGLGPADTVLGLARDEPQNPPLFYLLAHLWMRLFGDGVAAVRSLAALFGVGTVAAGTWWAHEAFGDRRTTALAAAGLSLSPALILFAQEARAYSLWTLLLAASSAALLRAWRSGGWAWLAYGAATTLALYTSLSHAGVIAAQVLWVAWQARGRPTRRALTAAGTLAVCAVLYAPWGWMVADHWSAVRASTAWTREIVVPRAELLGSFALNLSRAALDLGGEPGGWAWLPVGLAATAALGAAWTLRRRPLMLGIAAVPVALLLVPDLLFGGIRSVSTRYLLPTLLVAVVALARATRARPALALAWLLPMGLSAAHNAQDPTPWIKGLSRGLPAVARQIAAAERPLVVGDREHHNPGNLMALAQQVPPDTRFELLLVYEGYRLPADPGTVFLFSPVPWFPGKVAVRHGRRATALERDLYLSLWRLD
ncbi:MAG: glycosyltransferase family 39 protein [Myxococcales bacterium]|nr:glycosyltransferase family 39 protein [Myxococcales bacterium]